MLFPWIFLNILFIFRKRGKEGEIEAETLTTGIELVAFHFAERCPVNWAHTGQSFP